MSESSEPPIEGAGELPQETLTLLERAMAAHERGDMPEAEGLYLRILEQEPNHFSATHLLGVLRNQCGDHQAAADVLSRALRLSPRSAVVHLNLGIALWHLGRQHEAITHYRYALVLERDHPETLLRLAFSLQVMMQTEEALALWDRYLALVPGDALAHLNHGIVLQELHREDEARTDFDRALALDPAMAANLLDRARELTLTQRPGEALHMCEQVLSLHRGRAEAWLIRGNALMGLRRYEEALASFGEVVALEPDHADGEMNRGTAQLALGRPLEAMACYDRALALRLDHAGLHMNRGNALMSLGRLAEALASYDRAQALQPDDPDVLLNRGHALLALKRPHEALEACDQALALRPEHAGALVNRGTALLDLKRPAEALATFDRALVLDPENANLLMNHGTALHMLGRHREAVESYDRALAIDPSHSQVHSNRIFLLDFIPEVSFEAHQQARRDFFEAHVKGRIQPRDLSGVDRDPERRLVLGYVSADFKHHSAASCFLPILQRHAQGDFKVICYSGVLAEDDWTGRFKACAEVWRPVAGLSDDALADQIQADGVDILIDLSGHSKGNRLLVFARKPAPIQVTAWGHAGGTGLPMVDYQFTDPVSIPASVRGLFAEACYDLPCFITFEAPAFAPPVAPLPALTKGHLTFGSLNRYTKVTPAVERLWARILAAIPGSRLLLKDGLFDEPEARRVTLASFEREGIDPGRLEFRGFTSHQRHLAAYGEVDIVLDSFPQNGGITTWESLWMGGPVIALLGDRFVSRISGAILDSLDLGEWVAGDEDAYLDVAIRKAADLGALARFREGIRPRILASSAGHPGRYTRTVEAAYRTMWRKWTAS
ncbi:acetylglucosamine transferase [Geothrix limicola]|uniref:protein O-GlcNAc transferase n=1 Tax=Geothrix limicola TaxID=2927978 RepID=A0ABQ5QF11_9BACT|nr:tetratricopeptide repeat protein [Geothrix limicola]GLH73158.1 acetylglucosamine transferase [Geothrix limicola]